MPKIWQICRLSKSSNFPVSSVPTFFNQREKNMGKYLEKAASPQVLNHAWRYLRNDRSPWQRGLSVEDMQKNLIRHVGEVSEQLLAGKFRPEKMRCYEVDKADGNKRLICASAVRDKLVQRAILTVLEPLGEAIFHDFSFGFRAQFTLDMALAKVRELVRKGYIWLGDADIKGCFDNIPYGQTLKKLQKLCGDKELVNLVRYSIESQQDKFRPSGRGRGLPQGMVLSPFLCNLHLHDLDCFLQSNKIPFVRFADDFILFAENEAGAQQALQLAEKQLKKLGLALHPDKTRVIRSSNRHRFLGKRLPNGKPRFQL
jgi:RNA-directed DNA polymerase